MTTRVLFVCRGNRVRSPIAEVLFKQIAVRRGYRVHGQNCEKDCDFYVMSAGISEDAVNPIDKSWFDYFENIIAMDSWIAESLKRNYGEKSIKVLDVPDIFNRGDKKLVDTLKPKLEELLKELG